jgi:hypothetical protein
MVEGCLGITLPGPPRTTAACIRVVRAGHGGGFHINVKVSSEQDQTTAFEHSQQYGLHGFIYFPDHIDDGIWIQPLRRSAQAGARRTGARAQGAGGGRRAQAAAAAVAARRPARRTRAPAPTPPPPPQGVPLGSLRQFSHWPEGRRQQRHPEAPCFFAAVRLAQLDRPVFPLPTCVCG